MLAAQIAAIRATAVATVAQCDALLAALPSEAPAPAVAGPCEHPAEKRLAKMGGAWACCVCGTEGADA